MYCNVWMLSKEFTNLSTIHLPQGWISIFEWHLRHLFRLQCERTVMFTGNRSFLEDLQAILGALTKDVLAMMSWQPWTDAELRRPPLVYPTVCCQISEERKKLNTALFGQWTSDRKYLQFFPWLQLKCSLIKLNMPYVSSIRNTKKAFVLMSGVKWNKEWTFWKSKLY